MATYYLAGWDTAAIGTFSVVVGGTIGSGTATVAADKPLFTTIAQLAADVASFEAIRDGFDVRSLQDYALDRAERLRRSVTAARA